MRRKLFIVAVSVLLFLNAGKAQFFEQLSIQALVGYSMPQGSTFKNDAGEKLSSFGLTGDVDVLYHFYELDNKLGVGIGWNGSFSFAADLGGSSNKGGIYSLNLFGPKAQYRFFTSKVSPYVGLTLGAAEFALPKVTMTSGNGSETVVSPKESSWSLGIRPEVGIDLNGFIISVAYIVPMQYKLYDTKESAGGLQISIGYRKTIFDW